MDNTQLLIFVTVLVGILGFGALAYVFIGSGAGARTGDFRDLMVSGTQAQSQSQARRGPNADAEAIDVDAEQFRKSRKSRKAKAKDESIERKLFRAGFYSAEDRVRFLKIRIAVFSVAVTICPLAIYFLVKNPTLIMSGTILGGLIGFSAPMSWLEKQVRAREEDVMYFLPLVIEQVSIGVSSALDVGPCLSNIVAMASERDSHNPVTEMFVHVEKLIRSGLNLEDALMEVGEANGMQEVKHAFMFLAQCSKHGGEVSKQLQELADSVMVQRQVQIEGKIASLPVKATGPLATVFAGFFALLFAGLFVRLISAFSTNGGAG